MSKANTQVWANMAICLHILAQFTFDMSLVFVMMPDAAHRSPGPVYNIIGNFHRQLNVFGEKHVLIQIRNVTGK